jgi:hypothetical protein
MITLLCNVGEVSAANSTFSQSSVSSSSQTVKNYVEANHKIPANVTVGSKKVTSAQYLYLATSTVININKNKTTPVTLKDVSNPTKSTESLSSGTLTKTEYLSIASKINSFINANGRVPNYVSTSLGNMRYETMVYSFAKIMAFYKTNNRLPNTVSVSAWTSSVSAAAALPSNAQSIIDSIGYAEAKYEDIQGQSSASVMEKVGYGDCWADAEWLYNKLNAAGIPAQIMGYVGGGTGSWYRHSWVRYYNGSTFVDWQYTKYNSQHYGDGLKAAAKVLIAASSKVVDVSAMIATGY